MYSDAWQWQDEIKIWGIVSNMRNTSQLCHCHQVWIATPPWGLVSSGAFVGPTSLRSKWWKPTDLSWDLSHKEFLKLDIRPLALLGDYSEFFYIYDLSWESTWDLFHKEILFEQPLISDNLIKSKNLINMQTFREVKFDYHCCWSEYLVVMGTFIKKKLPSEYD